MMLPLEVIDYVVVHELCHLRYLNHSKYFWQLVANHFPNYIAAKQWIKTHHSALYWQSPS
jgi:predicted metal-dependent hydrolase